MWWSQTITPCVKPFVRVFSMTRIFQDIAMPWVDHLTAVWQLVTGENNDKETPVRVWITSDPFDSKEREGDLRRDNGVSSA
jgi:hypothetical protein